MKRLGLALAGLALFGIGVFAGRAGPPAALTAWLAQDHDGQAAAATPEASGRRGADSGAVAVVTAQAALGTMPIRKTAIGFVETPASVVVRSRLDSQVVTQSVVDGQFVKAGDLLFTLDDRDIKAQIAKDEAALARDDATHERIKLDLARYQQLLAKNAGTQQSVDQAIGDEKSAAATLLADRAALDADRLRLSYTRITAPIDGRVGAVQVTPGNLVSANGTGGLVTVTQVKPIRVSFNLPERELPLLKQAVAGGKPLRVTAHAPGIAGITPEGALNFLDSSVDMTTGTVTAKAVFPNDDLALWPGQYVDVTIEAGQIEQAVIVPTVAVQPGQKGSYVYVAGADGTVALKPVTVALTDGDSSAIGSGLAAGERVVTDGQVRLKPGARIREAAPAGAPPAKSREASS